MFVKLFFKLQFHLFITQKPGDFTYPEYTRGRKKRETEKKEMAPEDQNTT